MAPRAVHVPDITIEKFSVENGDRNVKLASVVDLKISPMPQVYQAIPEAMRMIAARAIHSADVERDSAYDEVACTACTGKLMSAMEARSDFESIPI